MIKRPARDSKRNDRNRDRKKIKRVVEHQASRRARATVFGLACGPSQSSECGSAR
jgi:hypothetical protein